MDKFQKGIILALREPNWKKFIKIPNAEIAVYVYIMNFFDIPATADTLKKFRPLQVANYKKKKESSYSYILTFQLLQDLQDTPDISSLLELWGLEGQERRQALMILSGLLEAKSKNTLISGTATLTLPEVFSFFASPKPSAQAIDKIPGLTIGKLFTGVGLFLTPTTTSTQADTVPSLPVAKPTAEDLAKHYEAQAEQMIKDAEASIAKKETVKEKIKKGGKKVMKEAVKKGIPIGILAYLLKKGADTLGDLTPLIIAYFVIDAMDNKKGKNG